MKGYFTIGEAAQRAGVGVQHMTRLVRTKHVNAERMGRAWIVEETSLDAYMQERRGPGRPPTKNNKGASDVAS